MALAAFLVVYVLGGLTFLPLLALAIFCHAVFVLPQRDTRFSPREETRPAVLEHGDGDDAVSATLPSQLKLRAHESDAAAGYFAISREFVPGGINGKPPERTTPAGAVVAAESPSVYQSMYRSIFERNKALGPVVDGGKGGSKVVKKGRNVFYVILRHGHLILFDDSEQLEVRLVVSLAHHDVDIYAGGEPIPEGELFIKRNCIRLSRKTMSAVTETDAKPFFLFSENSSEKEDFYHALLHSQERNPGSPNSPPTPLQFETSHVIKLVQQLHASEENLQTRWVNAMIGRLFLSLYKTPEVEDFIRTKIAKKIARVQKPTFISSIILRRINMGDSAPFLTNPKLKELTVDGDLTLEADVQYKGNFSLEIAAVARIDLGPRFKAREVTLVLAGILKKLDGHVFLRVKPPPSNRLWLSFEAMPQMEMSIEPVVSARQITYGIILRAIESRIREVIGETLVFPNWDDVPFHDTARQRTRGGIWADDANIRPMPETNPTAVTIDVAEAAEEELQIASDEQQSEVSFTPGIKEKTLSMPSHADSLPTSLKLRKAGKTTVSLNEARDTARSSSTSLPVEAESPPSNGRPRTMRSSSFASAAAPVVSKDRAIVEAMRDQAMRGSQDAHTAMKDLSSRSHSRPTSPIESPGGLPAASAIVDSAAGIKKAGSFSSTSTRTSKASTSTEDGLAESGEAFQDSISIKTPRGKPTIPSEASRFSQSLDMSRDLSVNTPGPTDMRTPTSKSIANAASPISSAEKRASLNQNIALATTAAKDWWANRRNRGQAQLHNDIRSDIGTGAPEDSAISRSNSPAASTSSLTTGSTVTTTSIPSKVADISHTSPATSSPQLDPSKTEPMGRGQPLPPPGMPLPPPKSERTLFSGGWLKRKPVPISVSSPSSPGPAHAPERTPSGPKPAEAGGVKSPSPPPPPLPQRPRVPSLDKPAEMPVSATGMKDSVQRDDIMSGLQLDPASGDGNLEFTNDIDVHGASDLPSPKRRPVPRAEANTRRKKNSVDRHRRVSDLAAHNDGKEEVLVISAPAEDGPEATVLREAVSERDRAEPERNEQGAQSAEHMLLSGSEEAGVEDLPGTGEDSEVSASLERQER